MSRVRRAEPEPCICMTIPVIYRAGMKATRKQMQYNRPFQMLTDRLLLNAEGAWMLVIYADLVSLRCGVLLNRQGLLEAIYILNK